MWDILGLRYLLDIPLLIGYYGSKVKEEVVLEMQIQELSLYYHIDGIDEIR